MVTKSSGCACAPGSAAKSCAAAILAAAMHWCGSAATVEVAPDESGLALQKAVETARAMRADGRAKADEPIAIRMQPGVYALSKPLCMGPEDHHLEFVCKGGRADITGGKGLGRFTADAKGMWHLKVPSGLAFDQLVVNGRRATVARSPNSEYYFMRETVYEWTDRFGKTYNAEKRAFLADNKADVRALAAEPYDVVTNARVHVFWAWDSDYVRVADVDAEKGVVSLAGPVKLDFFRWPKFQTRYVLENYRAALDEPGEWYFDQAAKEILYLPRPGEDVKTAVAEVPVLSQLVEIAGRRDARVTDVSFRGVSFGATGFKFPTRLIGTQSAYGAPSAINVSFADRIRFSGCRFGRCAGYALNFVHAVRDSSVRKSVFDDLGAGGVRIGVRWKPDMPDDEVCERIVVDDNAFLGGGRIFDDGIGIFLINARDCELTHNEIKDFFYSGISAGWTWGYAETCVRRNLIAWNHIRDIGQGVQSDMAGIYTLGRSDGTRIVGNVIHDVYAWDYTGHGAEGLYTDEGSVGIELSSNLVYRTKGSSFNHHYGNDIVVRNNIFYGAHDPDGTTSVHTLGAPFGRHGKAPEGRPASVVSGNILFGGAGTRMTGRPAKCEHPERMYVMSSNVYWSADGLAATNRYARNTMTFDQWRAAGFDAGSVFADPGFVAPEKGDFRLKKGSPALALGFREWDYSKAGARTSLIRKLAQRHRTRPFKKPTPPKKYLGAAQFETSFEPCAKGSHPGGFQLLEGDIIAVTEETARTGRKSVKVVDIDKKQARSYLPHMPATFYAGSGSGFELAISLKFDEKCKTNFEFREWDPEAPNTEYYTLSNVLLRDGKMVQTRGPKDALAAVKPGVWYDLVWTFRFGKDSTVYDFTVVSETGERIVMKDMPTNEGGPRRPAWFALISYGHQNGVLYLDDFRYGPVK